MNRLMLEHVSIFVPQMRDENVYKARGDGQLPGHWKMEEKIRTSLLVFTEWALND